MFLPCTPLYQDADGIRFSLLRRVTVGYGSSFKAPRLDRLRANLVSARKHLMQDSDSWKTASSRKVMIADIVARLIGGDSVRRRCPSAAGGNRILIHGCDAGSSQRRL